MCARNKPLDNLCIPNRRYYLALLNKIYKLDAAHINSRAHHINARGPSDAVPAKGTR